MLEGWLGVGEWLVLAMLLLHSKVLSINSKQHRIAATFDRDAGYITKTMILGKPSTADFESDLINSVYWTQFH